MTDPVTTYPYDNGYLLIRHMPDGTKRAIHPSDDVEVVGVGATAALAVGDFTSKLAHDWEDPTEPFSQREYDREHELQIRRENS